MGDSHETPLSATSRFLVELAAWILPTWALSRQSWVAAVVVLVVLVAVPATLNTPGDKNVTGVAISGRARIGIEAGLFAVAIVGAWFALGRVMAVVVAVLVVAAALAQRRRWRWLAGRDRLGEAVAEEVSGG